MPYYTPKLGVTVPVKSSFLFIHIPKTGGTSFEKYLKIYYTQTFHGKKLSVSKVSWQHQTYSSLKSIAALNHANLVNGKIFSIVRNPYTRLVSELFYNKNTTVRANQIQNESKLLDDLVEEYLLKNLEGLCDNHFLQQYKFLVDKNDNIVDNITIFKTETLTKELREYGFSDYKWAREKKLRLRSVTRNNLLGSRAICLINEVYKKDFELFGYKQL